jgi:hypothetical protein
MVKDWRDDIGPTLEGMVEKFGRRSTMDRFSRFLSDKGGWTNDQIHSMLKAWPLPKNALAGGMGGELAEDDEEERAALDQDIEHVMSRLNMRDLEGMGGTALSNYEHEPKARDRRRMAKDARLADKRFGLERLRPRANEMVNYGDQEPPLAYDQRAADNAAECDRLFGTGRVGIG